MSEAHADGYDEGEDNALVQGSAVLSLVMDTSFSLLLSIQHRLVLHVMTAISILHYTRKKKNLFQSDVH